MVNFAEEADVRKALQKVDLSGSIGSEFVKEAIVGASDWFARATNGHWFDSGSPTLIDTTNTSVDNVRLDLPSSPHRQDRALLSDRINTQYPVTHDGPFAQVLLPHLYVTAMDKLEVRDRDGDVTDWVADSNFSSGRANEYYLERRGQDSYGRTYLYVKATEIGARQNFENILTVDYQYGLDAQSETWEDVRTGIANLAAADLTDDDDVIAQLPDQGQIIGVDTKHQNLLKAVTRRLNPYLTDVPT